MNESILEKNDGEPTSFDGQIRKIEPKFYPFSMKGYLFLHIFKL